MPHVLTEMSTHSLRNHQLDCHAYYPVCQRKGQKRERNRGKMKKKSVRREKIHFERTARQKKKRGRDEAMSEGLYLMRFGDLTEGG